VIQRVDNMSSEKTPVHIDLRVDDPDAEVARLESLGATVKWVVDESAIRLHPLDHHGRSARNPVLCLSREEGSIRR